MTDAQTQHAEALDSRTFGEIVDEAMGPSTPDQFAEITENLVRLEQEYADLRARPLLRGALRHGGAEHMITKILEAIAAVGSIR